MKPYWIIWRLTYSPQVPCRSYGTLRGEEPPFFFILIQTLGSTSFFFLLSSCVIDSAFQSDGKFRQRQCTVDHEYFICNSTEQLCIQMESIPGGRSPISQVVSLIKWRQQQTVIRTITLWKWMPHILERIHSYCLNATEWGCFCMIQSCGSSSSAPRLWSEYRLAHVCERNPLFPSLPY